jgi:hypothetical protein
LDGRGIHVRDEADHQRSRDGLIPPGGGGVDGPVEIQVHNEPPAGLSRQPGGVADHMDGHSQLGRGPCHT